MYILGKKPSYIKNLTDLSCNLKIQTLSFILPTVGRSPEFRRRPLPRVPPSAAPPRGSSSNKPGTGAGEQRPRCSRSRFVLLGKFQSPPSLGATLPRARLVPAWGSKPGTAAPVAASAPSPRSSPGRGACPLRPLPRRPSHRSTESPLQVAVCLHLRWMSRSRPWKREELSISRSRPCLADVLVAADQPLLPPAVLVCSRPLPLCSRRPVVDLCPSAPSGEFFPSKIPASSNPCKA